MRLGVFHAVAGVDRYLEAVRGIAADGYTTVWSPQIASYDTLMAMAIAGREVPGIRFGTAVVPTYPRHPSSLAQAALTAQDATGGRISLGIGLSHKPVVEGTYGMSFERPVEHMREFLAILLPLLADRKVQASGRLTYNGGLMVPPAVPAPPVYLAALGPKMLQLAGQVAAGTVLWMVGPKTMAEHVIPTMHGAAREAGRETLPETILSLPVCLTNDVEAARERAQKEYGFYDNLPSYKAMLNKEGVSGPVELSVIGDEAHVAAAVQRARDAGADEFVVSPFGNADERARTRAFIASLA